MQARAARRRCRSCGRDFAPQQSQRAIQNTRSPHRTERSEQNRAARKSQLTARLESDGVLPPQARGRSTRAASTATSSVTSRPARRASSTSSSRAGLGLGLGSGLGSPSPKLVTLTLTLTFSRALVRFVADGEGERPERLQKVYVDCAPSPNPNPSPSPSLCRLCA